MGFAVGEARGALVGKGGGMAKKNSYSKFLMNFSWGI
jgi:hypothetical protein